MTRREVWQPANSASWRYADHADSVRLLLAEGHLSIHVPKPRESGLFGADSLPSLCLDRWVLSTYRCTALAPYVDRPFIYSWKVAADEDGEYVSGPAEVCHVLSEESWLQFAPRYVAPWQADFNVRRRTWEYMDSVWPRSTRPTGTRPNLTM